MNAPTDNSALTGLRGWWTSPPRSGMRLVIAPWEYRHLRAWATARIAIAIALVGLGAVTLILGGNNGTTYACTLAFFAGAAAHSAVASWLLHIADSEAART